MALNIKSPEADRLARELARRRQQSITEAVIVALRAELDRESRRMRAPGMAKQLLEVGARYAALPSYDERSDDEILGYDEHGVPG
jgi:antitoxin VapB